MNNFLKFILYSIVSAVIFIGVFFIFVNPSVVGETYEKTKDSIDRLSYDVSEDENIIFINNISLKLANPEPFGFNRFNDISYSISYVEDEDTYFIVADFKDESGYLNNKCYRVIHRTALKDTELCEECSNNTADKIYCDIHYVTKLNSKGTLIGTFRTENPVGSGLKVIGSDMNIWHIIEDYWKNN